MIDSTISEEMLEARHFCYLTLQSIFGVEPTDSQLKALQEEQTVGWFNAIGGDDIYQGVVIDFFATTNNTDPRPTKDWFTKLFIGPGPALASPWESVYRGKEGLLFTEDTLNVRRAYLSQGLAPKMFPHSADDHIALELDFMKSLAKRCCVNAREDKAAYADATCTSLNFLDEHLLVWTERFSTRIAKSGCDYYTRAAQLLVEFLRVDRQLLAA